MDDTPQSWMTDASCAQVGGDLWFADKGDWATTRLAREICESCPVRAICLDYGMDQQLGMYGGITAEQRKRRRGAAKRAAA